MKNYFFVSFENGLTKKEKTIGIIVAVVMLLFGVFFFARPLVTTALIEYIAVIGFIVYGVFRIYRFITGDRNAVGLIYGILWVVIGIIMLCSPAMSNIAVFSYVFGFMAMISGIIRLCAVGTAAEMGVGRGWCIASGVINIILALLFYCAPFLLASLAGYVTGAYLIVSGIMLIVDICQYGK